MIRIMILDDEAIYLEKERKIAHSFFARKGIEHRIEVFQSWEWFIAGLKEERFDLYILDIEMSGKNGLEVAREIRRYYADPTMIFITNYMDYAVDAYEVNTYRYIPKTKMEEKLPEAYESLLPELMKREEQYYVIEKKGEIEKIAYSDIYYMRKEGKYVVIVHRFGESKIRKSMIHFQEELKSREFLSVDKGMMVNIRHIMKVKDYEIFMRDGVRIPVGITKYTGVKNAVADFWRSEP